MISKLIPLTILFISLNIFSQKNEVGFFAGGSNYIGDIGPTHIYKSFIISYWIFI